MHQQRWEQQRGNPANWHFGIIYRCAEDPRRIVPLRRKGTGYAMNFAHRSAALLLIAFLSALLAPLALLLSVHSLPAIVAASILFTLIVIGLTRICRREAGRCR